jgi:branched-chain amino acid aminotransferase
VLNWVPGAEEADLPMSVLGDADEIFLTSTLRDVQGVHKVDARELPAPGPVTKEAMEIFAEHSAADMDPR